GSGYGSQIIKPLSTLLCYDVTAPAPPSLCASAPAMPHPNFVGPLYRKTSSRSALSPALGLRFLGCLLFSPAFPPNAPTLARSNARHVPSARLVSSAYIYSCQRDVSVSSVSSCSNLCSSVCINCRALET